MAIITPTTIPTSKVLDTSGEPDGSRRSVVINFNRLMQQQSALALAFTSDGVLKAGTLAIGTTVTLAVGDNIITIAGVPVHIAAKTGQAFGSLGTIPASTWGIIAVDEIAAGTVTFVSGSANYTTGYATEALAIAAAPAKTSVKARLGYVTILASASTWVAGTDALAGGTGGNPADGTNYYTIASPWEITAQSANAITLGSIALTAKQVGNMSGVALLR